MAWPQTGGVPEAWSCSTSGFFIRALLTTRARSPGRLLPPWPARLVGCPITHQHARPRPSAGTSKPSATTCQKWAPRLVPPSAWTSTLPRPVSMIAAGSLRGSPLAFRARGCPLGATRPPVAAPRPGSYITAYGLPSPSAVALWAAADCAVPKTRTAPCPPQHLQTRPLGSRRPQYPRRPQMPRSREAHQRRPRIMQNKIAAADQQRPPPKKQKRSATPPTLTARCSSRRLKHLSTRLVLKKPNGFRQPNLAAMSSTATAPRGFAIVDRMPMCCNTHMMQQHSQPRVAAPMVVAPDVEDVAVLKAVVPEER